MGDRLMTIRQEIAAAATVAGVTKVSNYYRQSLKPGDGFVEYGGQVPGDNGFGYVVTWNVWIALAQDPKTAEEWLEEHLDTVLQSLEPALIITTAGPTNRPIGGQVTNGVLITGTREG